MLYTILACFSLAAILGVMLLSYVLRNIDTPKGLAFIHGPIAALGLVLLIFYCFFNRPSPIESLILFIIAALGGFVLLFRDLTGKIPKWLALVHGGMAVLAFIFLLAFIYQQAPFI